MKNQTSPSSTRILFLITLFCTTVASLQNVHAATISVINTNDSGAGSVRQALVDANDGDTINFDSSLNGQTITLTSGELLVNDSITIAGPGANILAVNGNATSRVFHIASGKTVTISGLTITNGSAGIGGGIWNDNATLTVRNCTLSGNSAVLFGGGIYNGNATLTVNNSTLSGNLASNGGGIGNDNATLTVNNSTLSGNSTFGDPNLPPGIGGGIWNNNGTLTVNNSTLSGNLGGSGGGIFNGGFNGNATLTIGNTILKAGLGANISSDSSTVTSLGYNLSSDDASAYLNQTGDQNNIDPMLGPLQDNGGPTFTYQPLLGSPAIDGGDPTLGMDQRGPGYPRVANNRIDIGAFEVQSAPTPTPSPTPTATPRHTPKPHPTPPH